MSVELPHTIPDESTIRDTLRQVIDPEAGLNIVDLGLVYRVNVAAETLLIEMTMTSPACPLGQMIVDQVCEALAPVLPEGCLPEIHLVWEPPWNPSMMSVAGKQHFGW